MVIGRRGRLAWIKGDDEGGEGRTQAVAPRMTFILVEILLYCFIQCLLVVGLGWPGSPRLPVIVLEILLYCFIAFPHGSWSCLALLTPPASLSSGLIV